MGDGLRPATNRQAEAGVHMGCPYSAVGMHRALASPIGLPRSCTSAEWMLGFVTPPEVSKSFTTPPDSHAEGWMCRKPPWAGLIVVRVSSFRGPSDLPGAIVRAWALFARHVSLAQARGMP